MRTRILTCRNHPDLRWSCKDIAVSKREDGTEYYNYLRNLFFDGSTTGEGLYSDGSGLHCTTYPCEQFHDGIKECDCKADQLVIAPEDCLVHESCRCELCRQWMHHPQTDQPPFICEACSEATTP